MIRTFIDSGVLIAAARGEGIMAQTSLDILQDTNREFAFSIFLKMEVLPKAIYNKKIDEVEFYEVFFSSISYWATDINQILQRAYQESSQFGLGAMDALHVAAALLMETEEFITTEKANKSIHRTKSVKIISILNVARGLPLHRR